MFHLKPAAVLPASLVAGFLCLAAYADSPEAAKEAPAAKPDHAESGETTDGAAEDVVALRYISDPEAIIAVSQVVQLNTSVTNASNAKSNLLVEIRSGGCEGTLKGRVQLEPGNSMSFGSSGDYVKVIALDPSSTVSYYYQVNFRQSMRSEDELVFNSTTKAQGNVTADNRFWSGKAPVVITAKNNGTDIFTMAVPPQGSGSWGTREANGFVVKATGTGPAYTASMTLYSR